ncbi:hypothetical protein IAE29_22720 [Ochrobactrum sp. S46]|nr:hypothetical protein [Ochrobactrum sp. S45]MBK0046147.1 hypothetical protein [Ochrobactrum sp. S46]
MGSAPFDNVGELTKSVNASATHLYSRCLTGTSPVLTTSTVIDGITHTTKETKGKADQTLSIAYSPAALNVGTASSSWTYNDANKLLSVPGYISSVTYMAESQTKVISYSNGVTSTFAYSSQRSWITRVTTAKGTMC